ncbi:MAG: hypothetical protein NC086_09590, partial [Alistipes sp.]|nr:hypothetical protein [Alistipes sp.]
ELRTRERLAQPGGNIHYERFKDEVIRYIKRNDDFSYRRFDCSVMDYGARVDIEAKPLVIVEGAYSQHIEYRSVYDLKVFFDIEPGMQQAQILNRNGQEMSAMFRDVWIPMEEKYFANSELLDKSDMVIEF